ncbi:MAG: response regulator [Ignavibacteria bacterium]|jgi:two-component system alkaline phosphatase synthesis response regulator PhoP|nr:response regulator [Ignavibacteria bacterium]MDP3831362.1 response regulator [Ignavibacteriaceae bacterium]
MKTINKILLVDDDLDILEQTKVMLQSKGYTVIDTDNSENAWKLFQEHKPDAVVLDLIMEEHDTGFILSYKIKKDPHGKTIPVIVVTSAAYVTGYKFDSSTSEEKEWLKCDAVLNKPVNIEDLIKKFDSFIEKS